MPANIGAEIGGGEADGYQREIWQFIRDFPSLLVTLWKRPKKGGGKNQSDKTGVLLYCVLGAIKLETAVQPLNSSVSTPPRKFLGSADTAFFGGGLGLANCEIHEHPRGVIAAKVDLIVTAFNATDTFASGLIQVRLLSAADCCFPAPLSSAAV